MSEKKILRGEILQVLRHKAQNPEKKQQEITLQEKFLASQLFKEAKVIGAYLPGTIECSLDLIFKTAWQKQKKVVAPRAYMKKMFFYPLEENTEKVRSSFGILEPVATTEVLKETIDLLIVPGLIFNEAHYRIGFGGGYYDRFLQDFKGKTVSLVFPEQQGVFSPESFDIPIQELITL